MGAEPPIPCSSRNNVVISPTSWQGRVLILPVIPLKPLFFLSSSATRPIVRDSHDKRLVIFFRFFLTVSHLLIRLFYFFVGFLPNMATFCIFQKYSAAIRIFENYFLQYFDPLYRDKFVINNSSVLFFSRWRVRLCPSGGMAQTHNFLISRGLLIAQYSSYMGGSRIFLKDGANFQERI